MPAAAVEQSKQRGERFLGSVLWNWFGVAVSIFSGILLAPYTIHKLGGEGYGIWAVILAFVDYFWLMDLGFRSATLKYTAHYRAISRPDKVNEVINTALVYASLASALTMTATVILAPYIAEFENISPVYRRSFTSLLMVVGVGWASGAIFNVFTASLEGFQRFDVTSRIWIVSIAIRSSGIAVVLATGHGLLAMGTVVLVSLAVTYILSYRGFRRSFSGFRLSPSLATFAMFRQMIGYGVHTFVATISHQMVLTQSPSILVAHFLPTVYVGYYGMAVRIPNYSVDLVSRVGFVSGSHSAELAAKNDFTAIARMGMYINRYCLVTFTPMAIGMVVYGRELLRLWINAEFAAMSAPLLPVLAAGVTLGVAAQFNSSSILFGLGKHKGYSRSLAVEAVLCVTGLYLAIPRYGILGAAWVSSTLLVLNRGLFTSWLLSRAVNFSVVAYLRGIYVRPLVLAAPVLLAAGWVKLHWLPGRNWFELLAGGALLAAVYYAGAVFVCLEKQHRSMLVGWIRARLGMSVA